MAKIRLGDKYRDRISGYEGVVTGRHEYLNGCVRYSITAQNTSPNDEPKEFLFDEQQLEEVKTREVPTPTASRGGPRPAPRRTGH